MKLLRSFPVMAFSLVLLSIAGLCIAQTSVGLLLVAGTLAAMSWYVTEGPRGRVLPKWVSSVLIIAISLNVFVELLQEGDTLVRILGRFAVWITLIKLYERKTPRDYGHLLLLSLLLMVTGAVQSSSLLFGVVLLLYAVLGLYVLLLFQLHASHEETKAVRRATSPVAYRYVPPVKPVIGRGVPGHFRLLASGIGIAGLVLSAVIFLIFPRNIGQAVVPMLQGRGPDRRAGFEDTIDLETGSRITDDRRPVLTLTLRDEQDRRIRLDQPLLLRGGVLDLYEGDGRWRSAGRRNHDHDVSPGPDAFVSLTDGPIRPAATYLQEIETLAPQNVLFAMGVPVEVSVDDAQRVTFNRWTHLLTSHAAGGVERYRVRSQPVPADPTLQELTGFSGGTAGAGLRLLDDAAVRELARSVLEEAGVTATAAGRAGTAERYRWHRRAAEALTAHLQGGAYTYDLDLSDIVAVAPGDDRPDPVARFLLQTRRGHCEYFASGLASLCRNVGIPVRVITGYVAWEYDDAEERYVVLQSNAHAWTEVRTGPLRWSTIDPTPPATLRELHDMDTTLADRLSWFYQRFEGSWNNRVVSYDGGDQARMAQAFDLGWADRLSRWLKTTGAWLARVNRAFYFGPAGYIWMGVVAFALLLAIAVLVKLMRRTRALNRTLHLQHLGGSEYQRMLRQLGFYLDMLAVLDRAGRRKPAWMPPLHHAAALEAQDPAIGPIVRRITDAFYECRYGRRPMTREQRREMETELDRLRAALRGRR